MVQSETKPPSCRKMCCIGCCSCIAIYFVTCAIGATILEALAFSEDRSALGVSSERDERGLLKRNVVEANPRRHALCLPKDDFVAYFSKFVTRTVDPREAAEHLGRWSRARPSRRCAIPTPRRLTS